MRIRSTLITSNDPTYTKQINHNIKALENIRKNRMDAMPAMLYTLHTYVEKIIPAAVKEQLVGGDDPVDQLPLLDKESAD